MITDSEHVHCENQQATAKLAGGANIHEANMLFADTISLVTVNSSCSMDTGNDKTLNTSKNNSRMG